MSSRSLKIALAVSVALNVFAAAALGTTWINGRGDADAERSSRGNPMIAALEAVDAETREGVRNSLRESALAARPDFEAAREARRQAIALAGADAFDAQAVSEALSRSREAELRGRARLEGDAIQILSGLDADDRRALASMLMRKPHREHGRRRGGPPENAMSPPQPQAARDAG